LGSESSNGFCPRILCAPGFTGARTSTANAVVAEMVGIAERLRAVIIADGPNTTDAAAITYRGDWGSKRVYIVDPAVKIRNSLGEIVDEPASARVAGLIAKSDNDRGFWWSPSNQVINGIVGTGRDIDFTLGDANSRANLLNEQEVATVIRQDGYRLWGNRTASDDPKFAFLSVVRTADIINDSILRAHMWAVDRNITKTYLEDVTESVNAYMRSLIAQGALIGEQDVSKKVNVCYPDPDLNSPANIAAGKVYFNFNFTAPYPAERVTFRSHLVNTYVVDLFAALPAA
jgi:phage tail sheath protein FI